MIIPYIQQYTNPIYFGFSQLITIITAYIKYNTENQIANKFNIISHKFFIVLLN